MNLLVHFPTRGRQEIASKTLDGYLALADDPESISIHVAVNDAADLPTLRVPYASTVHDFRSKIAAYNAIPEGDWWDIVLGASDDMWAIQQGWDTIIRQAMAANFPDLDGCLWFSDGRQDAICTFSIMGRKAYQRDGFIYHPDYLSYWCDNEWTEVWTSRGKLHKDPRRLFRNEHPIWGGVMPKDETYKATTKHFILDKRTYFRRRVDGFK